MYDPFRRLPVALCVIFLVSCTLQRNKNSSSTISPPTPQLTAVILTPAGHPAAGATAILIPPGHSADITNGQTFDNDPSYEHAVVAPDGQLHFPATTQPFLVVVIDPAGYAQFDHPPTEKIHLQPWAKIQGRYMVGNKLVADQKVITWTVRPITTDPHAITAEYETETTAHIAGGYFLISRVPVGEAAVAEDPHFAWGQLDRPMQEIQVPLEGAAVYFGGSGRPVIGRIEIPDSLASRKDLDFRLCMFCPQFDPIDPPMPKELKNASLIEQAKWLQAFEKTNASQSLHAAQTKRMDAIHAATYGFDVQPDGTFRVDDVVPGSYKIVFDVYQKAPPTPPKHIGSGLATFTMPPIPTGQSEDPLTLPPIPIQTTGIIQNGDPAPGFSVPSFDGNQLKLSAFRGKFVLLQFWATWCGPCVAEMDDMKKIFAAYGNDPRFAMIGLSLDPQPNDPIQFIASHGLSWHEGFLGDWDSSPVAKSYDVGGIPSLWLISPEGKVITHSHSADPIQAALAKAIQH